MKIVTGICLVLCLFTSAPLHAQSMAGDWKGLLKVENVGLEMRINIHIQQDGEALSGKIDLLDQGVNDMKMDKLTFQDSKFSFMLGGAATYLGTLDANGKLEGKLEQAGQKLPLDFVRGIWVINRPQEPKAPFPYSITEVSYPNAAAEGVTLSATLTVPDGLENYPAVVLISGSGPSDRNEGIMMHQPFWVIADYLSRHGIAVLRFDDRGVGKSTGKHAMATSADFASDALAGVAYLKGRSDLHIGKIGFLGHSEGGTIGPMAATKSSDIGFVVMLAGTGVRGDILLARQTELVELANGKSPEEAKKEGMNGAEIFSLIVKSKSIKDAKKKVERFIDHAAKTDTSITPADTRALLAQLNNVWMRYFLAYDPAPTLAKVKCPVLAINGDKDIQVPADMNLPAIDAALKKGGNPDFKIQQFPGLNHLFQHCTTCSVAEYGRLEETISPEVLQVVGDWILLHAK